MDSLALSVAVLHYGKPFGFLFSISRYRELFPDIGKLISDIGKWSISRYREMIFGYRELIFRYREMCLISRYRKINSRYPKIVPPDRSRSLRHPATPPYHTAPYQQRPPAIPAPSACGHRHYDISKSQCTYSKTRSVQPTII